MHVVTTLRIDSRFRGPPAGGNGGYVAGALAETLGGSDCQVTLRSPPPLDRDLEISSAGVARLLWDGDRLVASAEPASIDLEPPPPPDLDAARAASARFTGFSNHIFPGCFVCGPERSEGDGLRVFAGPLQENVVAAVWLPTADLCDENNRVRSRFIWAALDCPGYFAVQEQSGAAVLGRFTVHIEEAPGCDDPLAVVGWHISSDGRKHQAGTALYARSDLVALGHATWVSF
jgi:hypothetical protein